MKVFSSKQWRIIRLVSDGLSNDEVAREIGTSLNMIKNYLRVIYDETGMNSRLELALWYVSHGCTLEPKRKAAHN